MLLVRWVGGMFGIIGNGAQGTECWDGDCCTCCKGHDDNVSIVDEVVRKEFEFFFQLDRCWMAIYILVPQGASCV